jgi:predicted dinucleotide-binding enzyme
MADTMSTGTDRTPVGALTVAVVGTGNVGGTLGRAFARAGHTVVFGSRDGSGGSGDDAAEDTSARSAGLAESFEGADAVVLAVPAGAVARLVEEHAGALAGRLIVDATNNIGGPGPAHAHAAITAAVPTARYARAFNSLGFENLAQPRFGNEVADLFFSSTEQDRPVVEALITAVGGRPAFLGEGQQDVIDGVLRLWFALAIGQARGRHLAFRVLDDRDS